MRVAIITGLVAFLCFLATPFLPVHQTQSSVSWPQNESLNSVNAPLISLAPESFEATIPLAAMDLLHDGETLLLGTLPLDSPQAADRGLFVRGTPDVGLDVVVLSEVVFDLTADELAELDADAQLELTVTGDGMDVAIPGSGLSDSTDEDLRPQVTGIYTEIEDTADNYAALVDAGLSADIEINSRFTTTPTTVKVIAMWLAMALALVSLVALWRMDRFDGRRIPFFNANWKKFTGLDGVVVAILGFWHVFGANTSDDGFITTMARVSDNAGYMANYYRWYGVPESPFGSPYYDLLALLSQVSAASIWMRLPALVSGLLIWWVLSREIIPRFGPGIQQRSVAMWTAAFVFLAFWLPYNNGTRPEPIVALGTIAAWALFERAIATNRLFPAAVGTAVAAFTLTVGPTGLFAVGAFLVAIPYMFRVLQRRLRSVSGPTWFATTAALSPFLAAGTAVLVPVFADQTLAAVLESTRVRSAVGPALDWYAEYVRYATLLEQTVDGSLTRRFAMLIMFTALGLVIYALIREGKVPGAAKGPTVRYLLIMALSFFFLMFTPTKWTHHFGIYAGMAAAGAALAAVVLSRVAMKSARARTFAIAAFIFLLAITFAGWNAWWYVSSFGIPWWDKTPQFRGVEFNSIILLIGLVVFVVGLVQSARHDFAKTAAKKEGRLDEFARDAALEPTRLNGLLAAPMAMVSIAVVASALLSFTKAFIDQAPSYTVGMGNLRTLAGDQCSLANEAMVETNTNDAFLEPLGDVTLAESLEAGEIRGFDPMGIPSYIEPENAITGATGAMGGAGGDAGTVADATADTGVGTADAVDAGDTAAGTATDPEATQATDADNAADTLAATAGDDPETTADTSGGVRQNVGVNGSTAHLPFNLDYNQVPVVGSFTDDEQFVAELETAWYELPEATEEAPLLVISAAGRIAHHDQNGVEQPGETLLIEYGRTRDDGSVEVLGEQEMMDIGPSQTWRNLRYPLAELPEEADAVRIVAEDFSLDPDDWIAVTPPRVPQLEQLSELVGRETPALLDWSVALQFPCQRSFDHYAGVTEIPDYRISPDGPGKAALTGFMDFLGGGSMATVEAVNGSHQVPSYTRGDWHRDWGSLESYQLRPNSQGVEPDLADVDTEEITRSGLWHPSDMKIREIE